MKHKKILCNSLFYFLLILICCSSAVFSSSAVPQTAAIFNDCLGKPELFEDSSEILMFTVKDDNTYYAKSKETIIKDKKPLLYACGDISINGLPTYTFESFPLQFETEDKPHTNYLAQRITIEGKNETFNDEYSVIISSNFYKSLFGESVVPKEIDKVVSISCGDKTVEARVETVFNTEHPSTYAYNRLFTTVYGENYCFINSNLSNELGLVDYCAMVNTTNYHKYFPHVLFKDTDYKNIEILSFYHTFSSYFDNQVKTNQKTRAIRFAASSSVFVLSVALSILLILKTEYFDWLFKKKLYFWLVFSLIFVLVNTLITVLVNYIWGDLFILLTGFGISFTMFLLVGIALIFTNIFRRKKDVREN